MIELILKCLEVDEFLGMSKHIDIAKGINKLPTSFSEGWEKRKRRKAWLLKE